MTSSKKLRGLRVVDDDGGEPPAPDEPEYVHVLILYGDGTSVWGTVTTAHKAERILENGDVSPLLFEIDANASVDELRSRNYFENVKDILRSCTNKSDPDPVTRKQLLDEIGPGTTNASGHIELDRVLEWLETEGATRACQTDDGEEAWTITRRGIESWMEWRGED